MYSPCTAREAKSDPVASFMRDRLPVFLFFASAKNIGVGFSEWSPSKSFMFSIFSRISSSTNLFSSSCRADISLLLTIKLSRKVFILLTSSDFFSVLTFFVQDWKLIIELRILPISTSRNVSSGQLRLIWSNCSGVGILFLLSSRLRVLLSFSKIFSGVEPFNSISYSKSLISRRRSKKAPTSSLPAAMLICGLLSEAWLRYVSAAAARATSRNLGCLRITLLMDSLGLKILLLKESETEW